MATARLAQPESKPSAPAPGRLPGVALTLSVALAAYLLGLKMPIVGGPVFGILLGMAVKATGRVGTGYKPGITFSSKQLLQLAIVLLGAGLSLGQVASSGLGSLANILITLTACFLTAWLLGRALSIPGELATLIGVGTGICGASAISAASQVVEAEERDVAYAISTIFAFNVAAVLLFPAMGHLLGMSQEAFGRLAGAAVNDTSSVVAAAYAYGKEAGAFATVVKLARSTLIIPVTLGLAGLRAWRARRSGAEGAKVRVSKLIPWFILWFLGASLLQTLGLIPGALLPYLGQAAKFLIVVALTGVGLSADFKGMARTGPKPLLLGLACWAVVTLTSLGLLFVAGEI